MKIHISQISLIFDLTIAQLKARYRKTFAGMIWVILNPLIMFGAQAIAFKHILKISIDDYYLYLLGGLVPWIFTVMTIQMSTPVLQFSGALLKSFQLNPLILIFTQIADNLINFVLAFSIMYIPIQMQYGLPHWGIFLIPIPLIIMMLGVASICVILSVMQVFYRDIGYVVNFVTGVLFFVTPVFFTADMIVPDYKWLLNFHIPYLFIDAFRACIYKFDFAYFLLALGKASIACALMVILANIIWKRKRNELYLRV